MAKAGTQRTTQASDQEEISSIQERFSRQVEQARQSLSEGMSGARERLGDLQTSATDLWDDTVDYIRENPGKVIAFSLGVGLALGLLLRYARTTEVEYYEQ